MLTRAGNKRKIAGKIIHTIGERQAIKNRRTEILMCNYETNFLTEKQLF